MPSRVKLLNTSSSIWPAGLGGTELSKTLVPASDGAAVARTARKATMGINRAVIMTERSGWKHWEVMGLSAEGVSPGGPTPGAAVSSLKSLPASARRLTKPTRKLPGERGAAERDITIRGTGGDSTRESQVGRLPKRP